MPCRSLRLWPQPCAACSPGTPGPNTHARPCPHALRCAAHALRQASTGLSCYVACCVFACCVFACCVFACCEFACLRVACCVFACCVFACWMFAPGRHWAVICPISNGHGCWHGVVLTVLTRWYCRRYSAALSAVVNSMLQLEPSARPDASQASACTTKGTDNRGSAYRLIVIRLEPVGASRRRRRAHTRSGSIVSALRQQTYPAGGPECTHCIASHCIASAGVCGGGAEGLGRLHGCSRAGPDGLIECIGCPRCDRRQS